MLIACKGKAGEGSYFYNKKAIYAYDLTSQKFQKEPIFTIRKEDLYFFIHQHDLMDLAFYADDEMPFQPSGIAVHPITQNIYVIGSVGKLLLVLAPNGELLAVNRLKRQIFPQPEGICFAPDGTLFISTEGKIGSGKIYQFKYRP